MRPRATALLVLLLVLLPAAAHAVFDLATLDLAVEIEGTNGSDTVFRVTVEITGTEIATATLTRGGATPEPIPLTCNVPTSCTATQSLPNQAALDALLPTAATSYTLNLTATTGTPLSALTDTFSFARPAVPSPAISAPAPGSTVDPGEVVVTFSACPDCNAATGAVLLESGSQIDAKPDLPATSTSWTPAVAVPANASLSAEITHATGGVQNLTADGEEGGTEDDPYVFTHAVTHSDSVAFQTGFAAPVGDFCIVVNDAVADAVDPTGCTVIEAPAAGIFDSTGSYQTTAAGIAVQYELQLTPKGRLSGIAGADLDGDASFETPGEVSGRLKGKEGRLRERSRLRFDGGTSDTRFKVRIGEEAELSTIVLPGMDDLAWLVEQKTRGKANGAKLSERTTDTRTSPDAFTGWRLSFTLTGSDGPISGRLDLASGASVALTGKQGFDSGANRSDVQLQSEGAERGIRVRVKRLEIDTTAAPASITAGALRFRAFGQNGSALLP
jgi:hypothetical protein